MNKKSFTLVEMLMVITIVTILLFLTLGLGWHFVKEMRFRNEKETFLAEYQKILSQTMSSIVTSTKQYTNFSLYITGDSQAKISFNDNDGISEFSGIVFDSQKAIFSGFKYSGDSTNDVNGIQLNLKSYNIGCSLQTGDSQTSTGSVLFEMISTADKNLKYCFEIPLDTCRLFLTRCN